MYNVAVCISTYNGTKYFEQQLESILNQNGVKLTIYIRDDGSTDPLFLELLNRIEKISNVYITYGKNLGVGNSFMECLYGMPCDFDYYALSDQDDVWLSSKLIRAIQLIHKRKGYVLYSSNQIVTDSYLNPIRLRFDYAPGIRYGDIIRGNEISGCTFVMNSDLFKYIIGFSNRPPKALLKIRIHDAWIAEVAALFGTIVYDDDSYILYRQHGNNIVGANTEKSLCDKINYLKSPRHGAVYLSQVLLNIFGDKLGEKKKPLELMASYQNNIINAIRIQSFSKIYRHKNEKRFAFFLKCILKVI